MFKVDGSNIWKCTHSSDVIYTLQCSHFANSGSSLVWDDVLSPTTGHWDHGFESRPRGNGCISALFMCLCCSMKAEDLGWAIPLSKESYQMSITQDSNSQETGEPWNRLVCHAIQEEEEMLTLYNFVQKLMMAMGQWKSYNVKL